MAKLNKYNMLL